MFDLVTMLKMGTLVALLSAIAWLYQHGREVERQEWETSQAQAVAEAQKQARATEQQRYGDLLNVLNDQYMAQRRISDTLADDLERLRQRPARIVRVPGDPAPAGECPPATGDALAREDAEFLVRYAALAADYDAALAACYRYADSLQGAAR
jgi:hypothetical protein